MNDIKMPATKRAVTAYIVADVVLVLAIFWAGTWVAFGDPPTWWLRFATLWLLGAWFNRVMRFLLAGAAVRRAMREVERATREAQR